MSEFQHALYIAGDAHRGQTRADGVTPYIVHPMAVAKLIADWALFGTIRVSNDALFRMRLAALLHDVVEDTPVTLDGLRRRGVEEDVVKLVDLLTKPDNGPASPAYYERLAKNPEALIVKAADRCCNLQDARNAVASNPARWKKYAAKTRALVLPLYTDNPLLHNELTQRLAALDYSIAAHERVNQC